METHSMKVYKKLPAGSFSVLMAEIFHGIIIAFVFSVMYIVCRRDGTTSSAR